jgi:FlaA1/EpsC-like NDP-sugar epimerase
MKILILGGTGSLGQCLVRRYIRETVHVLSRDEAKQWQMKLEFPDVNFIVGDIRDKEKIRRVISNVQPEVIIIAAAMKHIDLCERDTHECIQTNILGIKKILECVEENPVQSLKTVCFISTDKACDPGSAYGMSKALCEIMMVEKSRTVPAVKFVTVRYGNVLNSRGSIIPVLNFIGNSSDRTHFPLTHPDMNRYIMTEEQSLDLVDHAIREGQSGDIIIPELVSMNIKDLCEIYSEKYNKPVIMTGLRPGEKIREILINDTQSMRAVKQGPYIHIQREAPDVPCAEVSTRILTKEELKDILKLYM